MPFAFITSALLLPELNPILPSKFEFKSEPSCMSRSSTLDAGLSTKRPAFLPRQRLGSTLGQRVPPVSNYYLLEGASDTTPIRC